MESKALGSKFKGLFHGEHDTRGQPMIVQESLCVWKVLKGVNRNPSIERDDEDLLIADIVRLGSPVQLALFIRSGRQRSLSRGLKKNGV